MVAKILLNTSIKSLNKVYSYKVPQDLEYLVEVGKRVEVSFGRAKDTTEGIIVKLEDIDESTLKYKLKNIINILDDVSYIDEKELKLAKYMSHIYFCNVYDVLKLMLPPGTSSVNSSKSINTKQDTIVKLGKNIDDINYDIENNIIKSAKHIRLLRFLMENEYVFITDIIDGLNLSRSVINTVRKNGYIILEKVDRKAEVLKNINVERTYALTPTPEQKNAIDIISGYLYEENYKRCLLLGVTGSGKTEVYLQLIERVLNQGRTAIVLVPEISLTYQTVNRFVSRFGENIAVLHSKMSISDRKKEYKRIKEDQVSIVVGARSAIFAPLKNIGLVVIDEEHDSSYYSSTTPKYSTKEVASFICKQNDAVLLLGSATPQITTYYEAINGKIELIKMLNRPKDATLPEIDLVDMKEERILGNESIFSKKLSQEIINNKKANEQTMLFLNRRGYNSYLICKDCGNLYKCPNCDVALTYHKKSGLLLCHYCSYVDRNVNECPKCEGHNLVSNVIGTQMLQEKLTQEFENISTVRMDTDSTIAKDAHQKILDKFKNENIDVLIGTQMISKGHDIKNVTLVGVIGVDSLLSMNDYLASEKAFNNIYQVSGRAGRGEKKGRVVIQTNDPSNYILQAILHNDYEEFFENEIEFRKNFEYPPFVDLFLIEFSSKNLELLKSQTISLYNILNDKTQNLYKVFSPKSPFVQKVNNKYRINIIIKANANSEFYDVIYKKLNLFNKQRKEGVSMTICKNPNYIG